ncbi:MAG: hypothetical protein JWM68_2472 [Verrucomicrobiales bacterium]|nr:hypothetical protein [Verrucomicrobiales bacterium]
MKTAIIVGADGQDGRILFEQLRREGYAILGIGRESIRTENLAELSRINILDAGQVSSVVAKLQPSEIYYLAAFHHSSEELPTDASTLWQRSFDVHVRGLLHFLEAIKKNSPASRLFYAASSHIFGDVDREPQDEKTPFQPKCIYGLTKVAGIHACRLYHHNDNVFAAAGILYNHESPFRAAKFVSQKIIRGAINIKRGTQSKLILGDLAARIDWGYAADYVAAMRAILKQQMREDFVIATGETHSVLEFVEIAFGFLGLDWKKHIEENSSLVMRRRNPLRGDATKLRTMTGWKPTVTFEEMIHCLLQNSDETI